MKFLEIFHFEFNYQVRRPWFWLFFAVLIILSFLMTRDGSLSEVLYADFFINSPFSIAKTTVFGSLMWLVMAAAISGDAAARDTATRMYPLIYTTSIRKGDYLGARFLAAFVLNAFNLLAVQAGILLGIYLPGVHVDLIGPFRPAAFLTSYAFIALPNAFIGTAIQFSLAVRSGRPMASYFGSFLLVFMGFFIAAALLFNRGLGTLLDPIGIRFIVEDISHLWTTIEMNSRLLKLQGTVLTNRLVWLGIAVVFLAYTYFRFQFTHHIARSFKFQISNFTSRKSEMGKSNRDKDELKVSSTQSDIKQTFGFAMHARQTRAIAWTSFRTIAKSWPGLALLTVIPLMTIAVVIDQMVANGTPLIPTTTLVIVELTGPLSDELSRWVIVPLLIIFFAGELVWREREAGMGEIIDAMPGSEWAPFLGKFLGLGLMLVVFMTVLMAAGMIAQVAMNYQDLEIGLYIKIMFGLQLPEYLLFALLALVVHVMVDQKYIGHLVAILVFVFIVLLAGMFGIEHKLLIYGASPGWSYTEMRGFGDSIGPWFWFKIYWAAWALLLAVVAKLFWVRGKEKSLSVRIQIAGRRFTRPTTWVAGAAAIIILTLGSFISFNTNVLNPYVSGSEIKERRAEYERRYGRYAGIPQPHLTATKLQVEIYPEKRVVEIRGSYRLVNLSPEPIDSIHVATAVGGVETREITFDRSSTITIDDQEHGYRIYVLKKPLNSGDVLQLHFTVHAEHRGFGNRGIDPSITAKGSYFTSGVWFPFVGYQRHRELITAGDRRDYELTQRPVIASLHDVETGEPASRGGGIQFEAVIGTDKDEVAVAPGALRRSWTEGGRRYFHYSTDAPIGSEWAFFSANYAVYELDWKNPDSSGQIVNVRILHHPQHTAQLDRMTRSVRASLDYYTREFGPYPYGHLSIVEHPGAPGTGLHAESSMIYHGQGFPFWIPKDEQKGFDFPYAVVAHEMAHQWTLPYALVEGLPFLSEGLAWYSGIQVVKASRGDKQVRKLLAHMRQPYPHAPIRRGEPLLRALDPYLAYRRGPFAMYALSEYIGSDQVNLALRRLIRKHDSAGASLATTLDLYRELQLVVPDSFKYLLHDLFEVNTYWEFETELAKAKQIEPPTPKNRDGLWQVTLEVRARKMVYDSAGVVTEMPMNDWVQIGVFGNTENGDQLGKPLLVKMHRVRSGKQKIILTLSGRPARAGIDQYHLLDWEESDNNIGEITTNQ